MRFGCAGSTGQRRIIWTLAARATRAIRATRWRTAKLTARSLRLWKRRGEGDVCISWRIGKRRRHRYVREEVRAGSTGRGDVRYERALSRWVGECWHRRPFSRTSGAASCAAAPPSKRVPHGDVGRRARRPSHHALPLQHRSSATRFAPRSSPDLVISGPPGTGRSADDPPT